MAFGPIFHDHLFCEWDVARGYLADELSYLHGQLNQQIGTILSAAEEGAILVGNSIGNWAAYPIGTANTVLRSNGSNPIWAKIVLTTDVTGTLPVTNGGTGTATAFTTGSVVFAGASGVYTQDNANLFWDDTNNQLQLGNGSAALPSLSFKSNTAIGFYLNGGIVATKDLRVTSIGMLDGSNTYAGAGCFISGTNDWTLFQNGATSLIFETTNSVARFSDRAVTIGTAANNPATATSDSISLRNQKGLYWRNAANTADLSLTVDSSNKFDFTGGAARYPAGYMLQTTGGNGLTVDTSSILANILLEVRATTEQLRLSYDAAHYTSFIVSSAGALTVTPQAGQNYNLSLSTTGDFAVNTNQLYVDTSIANIGIGTSTFGASMVGGIAVKNGTAPTGNVTDVFQFYSADQTAGNAAPHFRTEGGNVIKLYKTGTYTPTNVTTDRSYDANATTLDEVADVLGTLIADLQLTGLLG